MSSPYPVYMTPGAPGHTQILGGENAGQAWTRIRFADKSELLVHWDGNFEVAGLGHRGVVTVYCRDGRRLHFSGRIIDMIEHQEAA